MRKRVLLLSISIVCIVLSVVFINKGKQTVIDNREQNTSQDYDNNNEIKLTGNEIKVSEDEKLIALTFDDGPGRYTYDFIKMLNESNAKVTFFMLGMNAEKYPETVALMSESGHELGSHTYDHKNIKSLTNEEFVEQLERTDQSIALGAGKGASTFRPPYGEYTKEKLSLTDKTIALWCVDTKDWRKKDKNAVCEAIVNSAFDGAIVLLHDIYPTTVEGTIEAIKILTEQGYKFVTVSELITRDGTPIDVAAPYYSYRPENDDGHKSP